MSKISSRTKNGYTLIEVLISLVIISILFGISFLNFRDFSRKQNLVSLSREIKGDLALARENAVSGKKPSNVSCNQPNTLSGYNFRVVTETNYVIEAVCSEGTVEVKDVKIPSGFSISPLLTNPIFFKVLSEGTNLSGEATITLNQENTEYTFNIYVAQSGEIK